MQIASLESNSRIIIWVIEKLKFLKLEKNDYSVFFLKNVIENNDSFLDITDLGLLPGGKIKLIKNTFINLDSSLKLVRFKFQGRSTKITF